jgi:hypothetical protein
MQIRDEDFWQGQKAEIAQSEDREVGEAFLAFIEHWCDQAEHLIYHDDGDSEQLQALRDALEVTEELLGKLPPGWLAHALVVILASWTYGGPTLFEAMTTFEKHLVADEIVSLQSGLQEKAAST